MKLTLAMHLFAQPIECGEWPNLSPPFDEVQAKEGRHAEDSILLLQGADTEEMDRIYGLAQAQLAAYRIFPDERMRAKICSPSGQVEEGATIVQQIRVGPLAFEAAVRVTSMHEEQTDEVRTVGFQYATLEGHPEMGLADFSVRQSTGPQGRLEFAIESWSRPGHWTTKLAAPYARWMQRRSTLAALAHFKAELLRPPDPE
jgi:uncharacterized protein (UPF0548 family)